MAKPSILVETISVENRQIKRTESQLADLSTRTADIQAAIASLTEVVRNSVRGETITAAAHADNNGFQLAEMTVKFGLAIGAEGGIIVTKATLTASIDVEIKFVRDRR